MNNYLDYTKALEKLCIEDDFTFVEARRLIRFRKRYQKTEMDMVALDYPHLKFIRWLVAQGKLEG